MEFDFSELLTSMPLDLSDYQYVNQLLNHRTIIFNDEVTEDIVEKVFIPLKDFEEDDSTAPVTLILNSPGGSIPDGFFLAHYLAQYKKKLIILVCGYAASMATILLAAGGKNENITRRCYPSSYGLLHDGYIALTTSETKSAEDIMAFNKRVDAEVRQFIIDNTDITAELYDSKVRHQWFLSAQEMLDLNLIDEIIGYTDVKNND